SALRRFALVVVRAQARSNLTVVLSEPYKGAPHLGLHRMARPDFECVGAPPDVVVCRRLARACELAADGRHHRMEVVEDRRFPADLGTDRHDQPVGAVALALQVFVTSDATRSDEALDRRIEIRPPEPFDSS